MRLDKMICHAGWGSRSEIRAFIADGMVAVNGAMVRDSGINVEPSRDIVTLNGQDIDYRDAYWIMLHKPKGVVSATDDPRDPTVLSLLDSRHKRMGLFPVGRLDKTSTGLVLLTNDGKLGHKLLSPKSGVEKLYEVTVEGILTEETAKEFAAGVTLADGTPLLPAGLEITESANGVSKALVQLKEGKYHQIKRMLGVFGFPVLELHRIAIGRIFLDNELRAGEWRRLRDSEIVGIVQMTAETL